MDFRGQLHQPTFSIPSQEGQQLYAMLQQFWQEQMQSIVDSDPEFKETDLPLARIKRVMKTDDEVKMISAEAPIIFSKACELFIMELTMRAWLHTEENKRRTLQRSDIAAAISKSDMFDFLIDIVPRDDSKSKRDTGAEMRSNPAADMMMMYGFQQQPGNQPSSQLAAHHPSAAAAAAYAQLASGQRNQSASSVQQNMWYLQQQQQQQQLLQWQLAMQQQQQLQQLQQQQQQ